MAAPGTGGHGATTKRFPALVRFKGGTHAHRRWPEATAGTSSRGGAARLEGEKEHRGTGTVAGWGKTNRSSPWLCWSGRRSRRSYGGDEFDGGVSVAVVENDDDGVALRASRLQLDGSGDEVGNAARSGQPGAAGGGQWPRWRTSAATPGSRFLAGSHGREGEEVPGGEKEGEGTGCPR